METKSNSKVLALAEIAREPSLELYLSKDILQGEKVPFYLTWRDLEVKNVTLKYFGFRSLVKLYNARKFVRIENGVVIEGSQVKYGGYIGGVLSTKNGPSAEEQANLQATIELVDGSKKELIEQGYLYSVRAEIAECPERIRWPISKEQKLVRIKLVGAATASIEIARAQGGHWLGVPTEVLSAFKQYAYTVVAELKRLKKEFPQYEQLLTKMTGVRASRSFSKYLRDIDKGMRKAKEDEEFMQSLAYVFVSAILEQESLREIVWLPLMEYFESNAAVKAFLQAPFLSMELPPGGARLRCKMTMRDVLGRPCGPPLVIDTYVDSEEKAVVPIKDIIRFERA